MGCVPYRRPANLPRNLRVRVACVNGCAPMWTTFTVMAQSPSATFLLPACSCGTKVRFIEALAVSTDHATMPFPRALSPREFVVFLEEALDPAAGRA